MSMRGLQARSHTGWESRASFVVKPLNNSSHQRVRKKVKSLVIVGLHFFGWPASGGVLLALGQSEGMPPWLTGSTTITGTLILGWFCWYTITKTIPEMQRLFREELAAERKAYGDMLKDKDGRHERETAELRRMLNESLQSDRRAVHDLKDTAQMVISQAELSEHRRSDQEHVPKRTADLAGGSPPSRPS